VPLSAKTAEFEVKDRRGRSKTEYLMLGVTIKDVRTKSQKITPPPARKMSAVAQGSTPPLYPLDRMDTP